MSASAYRLFRLRCWSLRFHARRTMMTLLLAGLLALLVFLALVSGSGSAGLSDALAFLFKAAQPGHSVISDLRAPRIAMALACGAMLGLSGAALQSLTRNGLADPGLLGVREGASLAVIALLLSFPGAPLFLRPVAGMAGGFSAALIALVIARTPSRLRFILVGIGLSWFLSAVIAMLLLAADIDAMQAAMVWMAGSLSGTQPAMLPLAYVCLALGGALLVTTMRMADVAALGETAATALGSRTARFRVAAMAASVLMTAAAVSCAGSLGFVGLLAPHLSRFVLGGGQAALLAGSALFGAGLVLAADTIGRTLFAPVQIPAGIVLSVIGVVLLVALLWQRRNQI